MRKACFWMAFLALLLASGATPASGSRRIAEELAELGKLPPRFSFVVLGDTRTGDDIYRKLLALSLERKPALIVNTGDQIARPGDREQWANFRELSRSVRVPYFLTVGNHDVNPNVAASEDVYRDEVDLPGNELYYSFAAGNALFIVLNSSLAGEDRRIAGEQLAWLERTLASSTRQHTFIIIHHPLFPEKGKGRHQGNSLDRYSADRDRLHGLFRKHRVTAVFQGHEHVYLRKAVDGVLYITAGGGGAPLYAKDEDGGFHHYVSVAVEGDRVTAEVVDLNGKIRDRFSCGARGAK